jgi:hypothetical protein
MRTLLPLLLPLTLLAACDDGPVEHEMASSYAAALDAKCENYGGTSGTWTKCLFTNKTGYTVPVDGMVSVCYKGAVKSGGRALGGTVDPHGALEVTLVCGGSGITKVKLAERG